MVTPELVRPIPKGQPEPTLKMTGSFLTPNTSSTSPQQPGMEITGPVPATKAPPEPSMPVEDLIKSMQASGATQQPSPSQQLQFVPAVLAPQPGQAPPQTPSTAPSPPPAPVAPPPSGR